MNRDVLIVGGGVIGLSIARELHKNGARGITIVEAGTCGRESSWAAAGMLGPQAEADEIGPFFDHCCRSRDLFPNLAAELINETGIDIELDRTGTLSLALSDKDTDELHKRFEWQQTAGLEPEELSRKEILDLEPNISSGMRFGLYFPKDWQVENRKLLAALGRYAELNNIRIREDTRVDRLIVKNGVAKGVETDTGTINAEIIVIATGAWTSLIKIGDGPAPFEIQPVRGQIIEFRPDERLFRHVIYSRRGYLVPRMDSRILAGSTSENVGYDKGITTTAAKELHSMANEISTMFAAMDVADQWSGLRPFARDSLPVIGSLAGLDGLLIATAHYRNGILLAPLTSKAIADYIANGVRSDLFEIYSPERFSRNKTFGHSI